MNFAKKVLMFVGFVVLAAALVSVVAPKATHAVVATLVQVTNTSANPVPNSSVDEPARHVWTAACSAGGGDQTGNELSCTVTVPSGEEVVVQTESYNGTADPANTYFLFEADAGYGSDSDHFFPAYAQSTDNGLGQPAVSNFFYTASATMYLDPGASLRCFGRTKGLNPNGNFDLYSNFSGYYVTLP